MPPLGDRILQLSELCNHHLQLLFVLGVQLTQSGLMVYGFCSVGPSMAAMIFNLLGAYRLNTLKVA